MGVDFYFESKIDRRDKSETKSIIQPPRKSIREHRRSTCEWDSIQQQIAAESHDQSQRCEIYFETPGLRLFPKPIKIHQTRNINALSILASALSLQSQIHYPRLVIIVHHYPIRRFVSTVDGFNNPKITIELKSNFFVYWAYFSGWKKSPVSSRVVQMQQDRRKRNASVGKAESIRNALERWNPRRKKSYSASCSLHCSKWLFWSKLEADEIRLLL